MTHIITSQATSELGYRADPADRKNDKIRRISPDKKVIEKADGLTCLRLWGRGARKNKAS